MSNLWVNAKKFSRKHWRFLLFGAVATPSWYLLNPKYKTLTMTEIKVGFAGALTQFISDSCFHFVDTVNVRCKGADSLVRWYSMVSEIWAKQGMKGFFVGINATFCASLFGGFTYFTLYKFLKSKLKKGEDDGRFRSFLTDFGAAAIAEMVALLIYFPFELVKARLQTRNETFMYKNVQDAFKKIMYPTVDTKNPQISSLYSGSFPYFAMFILYTTVQFSCYEAVMRLLNKNDKHKANERKKVPHIFAASILSGTIASLSTNWLEVITIRKQINAAVTIREIWNQERFALFVKGLTPRLTFNVCQSVMIFLILDHICRFINVQFED